MSVKLLAPALVAASLVATSAAAAPPPSPYDTALLGEMVGSWKAVGPVGGVPTTIILTVLPGGTTIATTFEEQISPADPVNFEQGSLKLMIQDQIILEATAWTPQIVMTVQTVGNPPIKMPQPTPVRRPIPTLWNVKLLPGHTMVWDSLQGLPTLVFQKQ